MKKEKFTDYLINHKFVSQQDIDKALTIHRKEGGSLAELLIKLGCLEELELVDLLSRYLGLPPVKINNLNIPPEILSLIPEKIVWQYKVLPIGKIGNTLTLAVGDPLDILSIDNIGKITGCEINPVVAPFSQIHQAITSYYAQLSIKSIEEIIKGQKTESLKIIKKPKKDIVREQAISSLAEAPVIKFTNYFLEAAVQERASDILIEPLADESRIRLRIDGILRELKTFPKQKHPLVISRIKVLSNLNIAEHRLPQEGRFQSKVLDHEVDFRISVLPSSLGEKAAIRILDKTAALLNLNSLSLKEDVLEQLKKDSLRPHGLLLVCGPTGSGKTTTLYSIIEHIYTPDKNIVTIEDPIEYQLKGINQVSINSQIGLSFAFCLRSVLRQDPDIIMVGEIRDFETADMAIKSALTGHLVLSTLHTTTSTGSIIRLVNIGIEPFLLSSTLIGVFAQRLVRKLCPKCKEKLEVSEALAKKYLVNKKAAVYKAKGCDFCQNLGYKGRTCLGEYLPVSAKIRNLINASASESIIKREARILGMSTLREDGLIKLEKGTTSLEEVLRVTAGDEPL